jgi:AcrR family transcriptional regulator
MLLNINLVALAINNLYYHFEEVNMNIESYIERAAINLLKEVSLKNLTIDMIVETAEVSKTSFYRHYLDKYDLINRIYDGLFPEEMEQVGQTFSFKEIMYLIFDVLGKNRDLLVKIMDVDINEPNGLQQHNIKSIEKYLLLNIQHRGGNVKGTDVEMAVKEVALFSNNYIHEWLIKGGTNTIENITEMLIKIIPYNIHQYFE